MNALPLAAPVSASLVRISDCAASFAVGRITAMFSMLSNLQFLFATSRLPYQMPMLPAYSSWPAVPQPAFESNVPRPDQMQQNVGALCSKRLKVSVKPIYVTMKLAIFPIKRFWIFAIRLFSSRFGCWLTSFSTW